MEINNLNTPDAGGAAPVTTRQQYLNIIQKGFALLKEQKDYTQVSIVRKLETLQIKCGVALFNKIVNKNEAAESSLKNISKGIKEIISLELGLSFDNETQEFTQKPAKDWKEKVISDNSVKSARVKGMEFHLDGRVKVEYKTAFFADAQEEVIEIGLRLNTFTNYFTSLNPTIYKNHIVDLLKKGVNVKAYLIDPGSNEARLYFEDRARYQKQESKGTDDVKRIIERLVDVVEEINAQKYPGKFHVYTYKHFPYANFFVVDGGTANGKMIVSHYIYGVKRAEGPSWEFSKQSNNHLYAIYWESVQKYIENAVPIIAD
jgi:hypothetical protein